MGRDLQRRLIVFSGPPCSGKTALAERLAARWAIPHLEMDAIRSRLLPDGTHDKHQRDIAYRALHLMAETLVELGQPVILDATYGPLEHRRELEEVARKAGVDILLVECKVSPEAAVRRFRRRPGGHPAVDLTAERVAENVRGFPYAGEGLVLDTEDSLDSCLSQIEDYIDGGRSIRLGQWSSSPDRVPSPAAVLG